ncbi:MAG: hypothetical protein KAJ49_09120, partial [Arcobacteraceae bacterium]|nr:hypothetical protein [Arcobacteraceae bacterium]
MKKILLILFLLITYGLSFDIKKFNAQLLPLVTQPVYNLDNSELLRVVKPLLIKHKNIKSLTIKESLDNQTLLSI